MTRTGSAIKWGGLWLTATFTLAGCHGGSQSRLSDAPTSDAANELAAHHGHVCPRELPRPKDFNGGFGSIAPAPSAPKLASAERAWVCVYSPVEIGQTAPTRIAWRRTNKPTVVPSTMLAQVDRELADLHPIGRDRGCSSDLGARWLLVLSHGGDLTGVSIDDYGCRDIRLTNEPFLTAPGDATQTGIVPGVLTGPAGLLKDVSDGHTR